MPNITIATPSVGTQAYFTFKEPINYYVRNKFNISNAFIKMRIVSIISMRDTILTDLRDPYTDLYAKAAISEAEYKKDLNNNVPVISLLYTNTRGVDKYIRVPLNYIESISKVTNIEYNNKLLIIDLNKLPVEYDPSVFFNELKDFIEQRVGVVPQIKDVSIGEVEFVDNLEHDTRETVRKNMTSVYKTLGVRLEEANIKHDQLLARLQAMNITLG